MAEFGLVVRARRAVTPEGVRPVAVAVADGRIAAVTGPGERLGAAEVTELADDEVLLPGLVDTHVHVNEPGRTGWEGFASATRAAAAGGVTTLVDMPLNSVPPTTTVAALRAKQEAASRSARVDVGFWGGAVPGNLARLAGLHRPGACGFKAFLAGSGVPEFGFLDRSRLGTVIAELARLDALLIVHAENPDLVAAVPSAGSRSYGKFLASRPPEAEHAAIAAVIGEARRHRARVHVLHLASARALPILAAARAEGVRVTAEICPHYLTFAAEQVPDGGTEFKCCPPIREAAHREGLWQGLADGMIDVIVSDHSPCPPALKQRESGDFGAAWGGVSSLQVALPAVWTQARQRGHGLADVARWMAAGPAALAGLPGKGAIAAGKDADLVAFADAEAFTVDPARLYHRHPVTPYAGRTLIGVVRRTWRRGEPVHPAAGPASAGPACPGGRLLRRESA